MPPPVELTVTKQGTWKPAGTKDRKYLLVVEYSKSGRARCRRCGDYIPKDTPRIGLPVRDPRGDTGWISAWQHVKCTRVDDVSTFDAARDIHGFGAMSKDHCAEIEQELARSDIPGHLQPLDPDIIVQATRKITPCPTPAALQQPLLPFQEEGVGWMCAQELSPYKGGILADEMGMGKTIQAISLILVNKPAERAPTLVICPTSAMMQWRDEIKAFTEEGALSVLVYHSDRKKLELGELEKHDIVLTTYPVVEAEWRKIINKHKVQCEFCNKRFLPRRLEVHNRYFCGPEAEKTTKLMKTDTKRQRTAVEKAMETLKIIATQAEAQSFGEPDKKYVAPTITNVYRELMVAANRQPSSMYTKKDIAEAKSKQPLRQEDEAEDDDVVVIGEAQGVVLPKSRVTRKRLEAQTKPPTTPAQAPPQTPTSDATPSKPSRRQILVDSDSGDVQVVRRIAKPSLSNLTAGPKAPPKKAPQKKQKRSSSDSASSVSFSSASSDSSVEPRVTRSKRRRLEEESKKPAKKVEKADDRKSGAKKKKDAEEKAKKKGKEKERGKEEKCKGKEVKKKPVKESKSKQEPKTKQGKKRKQDDSDEEPDLAKLMAEESGAGDNDEDLEDLGKDGIDISESPLHAITWHRILLDEAHKIKGRTTSTAKSVYSLKGVNKWCLTGTPIQNRVGELYSLVRFLRMAPFAKYYCNAKECKCSSYSYSFGLKQSACERCGHSPLVHYSYFNRHVINPIKRYGYVGDGRRAMVELKEKVLDQILLRRTKKERAADVKLPPLTIKLEMTELDEQERDFYEAIYKRSSAQFNTYVEKGTLLHNYAHIFDLLSRLRQAVDHPYLVIHSGVQLPAKMKAPVKEEKPEEEDKRPELPSRSRGNSDVCGICQDDICGDGVLALCKHTFHYSCMVEYTTNAPQGSASEGLGCPVCFTPLSVDLRPGGSGFEDLKDTKPESGEPEVGEASPKTPTVKGRRSLLQKLNLTEFASSTKVEALVNLLQKVRDEDSTHKAIVFSQFANMLDIVEWRLLKTGIKTVKLLGSMPVSMRMSVLKAFKQDPNVHVILMSLKAGGEGLNLQVASHVFLIDPWWNPAVELQAMQRAHRIGQRRAVTATRLITAGTIEERMLQLQEKKQLVFEGTIENSSECLARLTEEDLKFLFTN
eukprot:TRINITY_DN9716_c0_g1_i1.p1 TRINITY_DN9716_c0_g1~~TRINITY_DN9716_c0_g1_i1.p1  ORF type:complete len:1165 (-),score=253.85 TRINITY_DN9716_c0_g1_i1:69-3533(-)